MTFVHRTLEELLRRRTTVADEALIVAQETLDALAADGEAALRRFTSKYDECDVDAPLYLGPSDLRAALDALPDDERARLQRVASRIRAFADRQRAAFTDIQMAIDGGTAGHTLTPVATAGCYAPGGRYPLPSSVLMTAVTARAAGVEQVWVASPKPAPLTLAAAAAADVDGVLVAGGAHAIGAFALGMGEVPACDIIVGPGNRYVTAAKQLVSGQVKIDMLAGPSELLVVADDSANPAWIAADLLAQAEHDTDAVPVLITWSREIAEQVGGEIEKQLADLPTHEIARAALRNGGVILVKDVDHAIAHSNAFAPEHLQISCVNARKLRERFTNFGGAFIGERSAEVFGDYGFGPNHVLPTGGTARYTGGLSVMTFLKCNTWLDVTPDDEATDDVIWLARHEGLEAHARAAAIRRQ